MGNEKKKDLKMVGHNCVAINEETFDELFSSGLLAQYKLGTEMADLGPNKRSKVETDEKNVEDEESRNDIKPIKSIKLSSGNQLQFLPSVILTMVFAATVLA